MRAMKNTMTGFISVERDEAMTVYGGTELEDAARMLGRMLGHLVGALEKLFDGKSKPQASVSF